MSEFLRSHGLEVNKTTVYRNLDKLAASGHLVKHKSPVSDGYIYATADEESHCCEHIHFRCRECGAVLHLSDSATADSLRYVILTRLPFRMPSDPLEQAKVESMERRGFNPFMDYSLPSAVIRFKQGFGRLIRSKNDYGVVTLLDSRALNKSYGRLFFQSLPRCQFVSGSLAQLCDAIEKFFTENANK